MQLLFPRNGYPLLLLFVLLCPWPRKKVKAKKKTKSKRYSQSGATINALFLLLHITFGSEGRLIYIRVETCFPFSMFCLCLFFAPILCLLSLSLSFPLFSLLFSSPFPFVELVSVLSTRAVDFLMTSNLVPAWPRRQARRADKKGKEFCLCFAQ